MAFKSFDNFWRPELSCQRYAFSCSTFLGKELLTDEIHPLTPLLSQPTAVLEADFFNILVPFNNQFGVNSYNNKLSGQHSVQFPG